MGDVFVRAGYNGIDWTSIILGVGDYLGFFGTIFGAGISPGVFNKSTHDSNSLGTVDNCITNHMRNCEYKSPTEVSLMGAATVDLTEVNVAATDCTLKWNYLDDAPVNTSLSNCLFYAYDGVGAGNPPVGCTILAAERTAGGINKDRLSDTPGDGYAWHASYGIGGYDNALMCDDQGNAADHDFYFVVSGTSTSKGLKSYKIRLEFDAT